MQVNTLEPTAFTLEDLLKDRRLTRLFSQDSCNCALQLWILQVKSDKSAETRIVYGRLLPYSHSNNSWSFSDNDDFRTFGQFRAKVTRLNLYVKSDHCAELLRLLSAGVTISSVSEQLKLGLPTKLKAQFGETSLAPDNLTYRPVAYLLNRDAYERRSLSSPHGAAGAFSASISQTSKRELFRLSDDYDIALTASVVNHLNGDTGLDFGGADTVRFGDLELLVFPTLDDQEQRLLDVSWVDAPRALVIRFNATQVPHFSGFQFRLSIANDAQIIYSAFGKAERDAEGVFEYKFAVGDQLRALTDSTELEIFGFHGDHSYEGVLCCRWRIGYVREVSLQGHVVGHSVNPVKFDWLERTTRPSVSKRVEAALTIDRGDMRFENQIGGRKADAWVPANRDLTLLFEKLHPPKSEGQFFPRWTQGDGEGRLQLVEWFKALLANYQQHQIVIFDPYFEAAGLGLMLLCAAPQADYIVFTSLPKPSKEVEVVQGESDRPTTGRINNLVASCEHNSHQLRHFKLRIYGLKDGRLHDRYILIMGQDGLPVAGFNLSNSFQKAAENYPLLVTPIPADVLLKVEQYKSELLQEATTAPLNDEIENPTMQLLFNSMASPMAPRRYEPLRFLETAMAGDILGIWSGESSLKGLTGEPLKARMMSLNLLENDSLMLFGAAGLCNCLDSQAGDFGNFTKIWEMLGEVLAHSHTQDWCFREVEFERGFLGFLKQFLEASFNRTHDEAERELATVGAFFFREQIEVLLQRSYRIDHLFHPTKYAALSWPEYFAIKFLWWHDPCALLTLVETQAANLPVESGVSEVVRLSLLSQVVSEISLSIQFDLSKIQRDRLISSRMGLLHWMGLNAIEGQLEKEGGLAAALQLLEAFDSAERVRTLGWMVQRTAGSSNKAEIYKSLIAALYEALPQTISADELGYLVDSMRGHMRQLAWAEPWLFQDVVLPLLQSDRAAVDDACAIWTQELVDTLGPQLPDRSRLFNRAREGQTTNIAAFLFAYSNCEQQRVSLASMKDILKRQQRVLQQPLASTSDWARWDGALTVSLWILSFARWSEFYLRQRNMTDSDLEQLSLNARGLAMLRPMDEWRSERMGTQGELAAFLDQVDVLLDASDESESNCR